MSVMTLAFVPNPVMYLIFKGRMSKYSVRINHANIGVLKLWLHKSLKSYRMSVMTLELVCVMYLIPKGRMSKYSVRINHVNTVVLKLWLPKFQKSYRMSVMTLELVPDPVMYLISNGRMSKIASSISSAESGTRTLFLIRMDLMLLPKIVK